MEAASLMPIPLRITLSEPSLPWPEQETIWGRRAGQALGGCVIWSYAEKSNRQTHACIHTRYMYSTHNSLTHTHTRMTNTALLLTHTHTHTRICLRSKPTWRSTRGHQGQQPECFKLILWGSAHPSPPREEEGLQLRDLPAHSGEAD
jgi:hypothetical protein